MLYHKSPLPDRPSPPPPQHTPPPLSTSPRIQMSWQQCSEGNCRGFGGNQCQAVPTPQGDAYRLPLAFLLPVISAAWPSVSSSFSSGSKCTTSVSRRLR